MEEIAASYDQLAECAAKEPRKSANVFCRTNFVAVPAGSYMVNLYTQHQPRLSSAGPASLVGHYACCALED